MSAVPIQKLPPGSCTKSICEESPVAGWVMFAALGSCCAFGGATGTTSDRAGAQQPALWTSLDMPMIVAGTVIVLIPAGQGAIRSLDYEQLASH